MPTPSRRLFIALRPDHQTCQALARLRARAAPHIEGIRWTAPENWHVTLHFLGACSAELTTRLAHELPDRAADFTALQLAGRRLQGFPSQQRAGRIWALTLERQHALSGWHARLGRWLEEMGLAVERRPLKAHITLARSASARLWPLREAPLACHFDRLALYESIMTPRGPVYQSLSAAGASA